MKRLLLGGFTLFLLFTMRSLSGCVGDDPAGETTPTNDGGGSDSPAGAKDNGVACGGGAECKSGTCADGVCCDSACNGVCEKCNLPGSSGRCVPVPAGEDPDKECKPAPLSKEDNDAGAADGGGVDGGDAGKVFAIPDGGTPPGDDNQCAGSCDGNRACKFPGTERTCGAAFCGNTTQQGRASCDAKGHCLYGVEECSAFSCPDGSPGCKKTCTAESDCLPTHFCEASSSTCKPKTANGSQCTSVATCSSGNCVQNVCCNSVCDIAGGSCTTAGSVGTCKCSACATGPCELFYRDEDEDGFGDKFGTVANGRAAYGCVGTPPAGYVANKTDCFDGPKNTIAANVFPGQTQFFQLPYNAPQGGQSYDYDCNDVVTKQTPEFGANATCTYCRQMAGVTTCHLLDQCGAAGAKGGFACLPNVAAICKTNQSSGFKGNVECGSSAPRYTCSTCTAIGGASTDIVEDANFFQLCK